MSVSNWDGRIVCSPLLYLAIALRLCGRLYRVAPFVGWLYALPLPGLLHVLHCYLRDRIICRPLSFQQPLWFANQPCSKPPEPPPKGGSLSRGEEGLAYIFRFLWNRVLSLVES